MNPSTLKLADKVVCEDVAGDWQLHSVLVAEILAAEGKAEPAFGSRSDKRPIPTRFWNLHSLRLHGLIY